MSKSSCGFAAPIDELSGPPEIAPAISAARGRCTVGVRRAVLYTGFRRKPSLHRRTPEGASCLL